MKNATATAILTAGLLGSFLSATAPAVTRTSPLFIDHNCTDLAVIPLEAIAKAQDSCKWHYVRLSHGRQLTEGLARIEAADPFYAATWPKSGGSLPDVPNTLCIYSAPYSPDGYWSGGGIDITRNALIGTPELNISAFSWCGELNAASESYVANYLTAMQTLENEFPNVTFVYFTGTAQYNDAYGYNRYLRNQQIRNFCFANNKVLYDFEDLDSWWYNPDTEQWEQATYEYNGCTIPVEHPMLAGNDAEHTSYASCEQKGRATWWMMAVLSGWKVPTAIGDDGGDDAFVPPAPYEGFELSCYPNPFNPSTTISFSMAAPADAKLAIYDAKGALVRTLVEGVMSEGQHRVRWNGTNESGSRVATGVYFYRIVADKKSSTKKMLLLR
jgi:hypothetical protein